MITEGIPFRFVIMINGRVQDNSPEPGFKRPVGIITADIFKYFEECIIQDLNTFISGICVAKSNTHAIGIVFLIQRLLAAAVSFLTSLYD